MKSNPLFFGMCLFSLLFMAGCQPTSKPEAKNQSDTGLAKTDVTQHVIITLTPWGGGNPVSLDQFAGKNMLLVFFAPWTDSGTAVVQWINDVKLDGVEIFPVVVDKRSDAIRTAAGSIQGLGRTSFIANDPLPKDLGNIRALPTAVWLDSRSVVAGTWIGLPSFTGIVTAISAAVAPL
jgi:hypothetical protein